MRSDRPGADVSPAGQQGAVVASQGLAGTAAAQTIGALGRGRPLLEPRRVRIAAVAAFIVGTVAFVAINGLMLSRDLVSLWILTGLVAVSVGDGVGATRRLMADWLPFFGALFAYDLLRGWVGGNPLFEPHIWPQIDFDEVLFGSVPTVELQERFFDAGQAHWYDIAAWSVYLTHFAATFVIAAVLWRLARPQFLRFRAMILTLTVAAFVTYALFPAVPPWLASDGGAIGPVGRVVGDVWATLGIDHAAAIWEKGSAFANEVAAIPSLHTAYPVLFLCFFWSRGGWVRVLCLTYALAMSLALVYTGEHYVADVALGWIYAIATYHGVAWILRRRAAGSADPVRRREAQPMGASSRASG